MLINSRGDVRRILLVDADCQLAERLQAEEQEQLTDAEKAELFIEIIEKSRKIIAEKRTAEKRNKPPIKAQQRSIMNTYLKNMDGWKPRALKNKSFAKIKELFDKAMKRITNFIDFKTELVKVSIKNDEAETAQESSSKRARDELDQERSKKQKAEEDKESEELKKCLEIIPDDGDDVTIDATPLSYKSPTIVDYKIYKEGKKNYFQIFRVEGNSQMYLTFSKLLKNFDKEDLEVLWRLVKNRFVKTKPVDDMDNFLLHNLKTMFEHHVEDNVWKNQQGLTKVKNWKLFDSFEVYCVTMQNILYYLLVKKMYPLTNHTLHQIFNNVKLQVDWEDYWDIKTKDFIDAVKDYYCCWSSWKRRSEVGINIEVTSDVFSSMAEQTSLTPEFVNAMPNQPASGSLQPTSPNAIGLNLNGASSVPNVIKVDAIFAARSDQTSSIDGINPCGGDNVIPTHESPIVKFVSINAKSNSYAGAGGASSSKSKKGKGVLGRCFSWCMNEVNADNVLKESITMGISLFSGSGFYKEMVCVEYEWKPPYYEQCKIFCNVYDQCPKNATVVPTVEKMNNDGFQTVVNKRRMFEPNAHRNSSKNVAPSVSTFAKDGHTKQPTKAIDIPSSSSAKKRGPQIHTSSSNVPNSNPYDLLSQEFDPENYKRTWDDPESEEEVKVICDESINLLNDIKPGATYTALDASKT
nr:hypothetical protein [Tanacetum cinerariifolium]